MKKVLIIACISILIVVLGVFGIKYINKDKKVYTADELKFKEDYESLNGEKNSSGKNYRVLKISKDNNMIYSSVSEVLKKIENKETFVVYFGFNSCPWCRSVLNELISASNDLNINKIYYVNVRENGVDIRDTLEYKDGNIVKTKEGVEGYDKLLEVFNDVLSDYSLSDSDGNKIDSKEKRIYAPNVIAIVNGKAAKLTSGISDSQNDAYMDLTNEMKKETYDKFTEVLKLINNTSCGLDKEC